ncbi:MAG: TlpA family protein disulfide reductase [bacterium]|nr:TlpA family protein disulfide reductase [bacterium]
MEETQLVNGDAADTPELPESEPRQRRDWTKGLLGLVVFLLLGVLVLQVIQLQRSNGLRDDVSALTEDVTDLKPLRRDVDVLGDQMAALDQQVTAAVQAAGASPAAIPAQPTDGALPLFEDSSNDPAVLGQMKLATITGPEYYSGAEASFSTGDGKARVWMIWAHWCPYCQAELPEVQAWWSENAERFPNVEFATVTSAIDDSRSNPLTPYLDAEQFVFPVVVDRTGEVSRQFGTVAFPFWVVTDSEGTVILRVAGALGVSSIDQIFSQLETMTSET